MSFTNAINKISPPVNNSMKALSNKASIPVNAPGAKSAKSYAAMLEGLMQSQGMQSQGNQGTGNVKAGTFSEIINGITTQGAEEQVFEEKLKRAMENKDEKMLKEACRQFEELFLQVLYKQMKATVPRDGLFSGGIQQEVFDSMLDESLMKEASKAGGIGIADMMYKQMSKDFYK